MGEAAKKRAFLPVGEAGGGVCPSGDLTRFFPLLYCSRLRSRTSRALLK